MADDLTKPAPDSRESAVPPNASANTEPSARRVFFGWAVVAIALGVAGPLWVGKKQAQYLASLESGMDMLQQEIDERADLVADIKRVKHVVVRVLTHKAVLESLQKHRNEAVSILNFFAEETPADVVLTELRREGRTLRVRGIVRPHETGAGKTRNGEEEDPALRLARQMMARRDIFAGIETPAAYSATDVHGFEVKASLVKVFGDPAQVSGNTGGGPPTPSDEPADASPVVATPLTWLVATGILVALLGTIATKRFHLHGRGKGEGSAPALPFKSPLLTRRRDVATRPDTLRILVLLTIFLGTFLAASGWVVYPANSAIIRKLDAESTLRDELAMMNRLSINRLQYRAQLLQLDQTLIDLQRRLPQQFASDSDMESLLGLAAKAGLAEARQHPGNEQVHDFFAEKPLRLAASGSFLQVGDFFAAVGRMDRIAEIADFSLKAASGKLAMEADIVTYRVVEEGGQPIQDKPFRGEQQ